MSPPVALCPLNSARGEKAKARAILSAIRPLKDIDQTSLHRNPLNDIPRNDFLPVLQPFAARNIGLFGPMTDAYGPTVQKLARAS
jgi:hypothetical protein